MSELVDVRRANESNFRWGLLATVSALALIGSFQEPVLAGTDQGEGDHPTVWVELGGQLSRLGGSEEAFSPLLMTNRPQSFSPSQRFERLPLYSFDETGKLSIEPKNSDWIFSAAVRYGRSSSHKKVRQQTNPANIYFYRYYYGYTKKLTARPLAARFADTNAQTGESHLLLDFQVGKDVGLGMFGVKDGSSVLNLGVRIAQFQSKSNIALKSDPDWQRHYKYVPQAVNYGFTGTRFVAGSSYHTNSAKLLATRSFHGMGPSISWNGSAPLAGTAETSGLSFDWGLNAAILFGRQRMLAQHQASATYHAVAVNGRTLTYNPPVVNLARSRSVTVPNVGGFAGMSFRYSNAKVSFGYRADTYFGAMDGGIDERRTEDVGFYGPYAIISIGLGG